MEPFFEPVSVIDASEGDGNKPVRILLSLDAKAMTAWAAHVSNGTRARMHGLEDVFLEQLAQKRFLSAMIISRAHMESAALAAYAEYSLVACEKKQNWEKMKTITSRMLFGTSFKREQKSNVQDLLDWSAQEPVQIMDAIDAMDHFAESTGALVTRRFRAQYAYLCEYAHPSMNSTRGFLDVVEENRDGWVLKYRFEERVQEVDARAALAITIDSMRVGYANALLLAYGTFKDDPSGIIYSPPPIKFARWVWENIVHGGNKNEANN